MLQLARHTMRVAMTLFTLHRYIMLRYADADDAAAMLRR